MILLASLGAAARRCGACTRCAVHFPFSYVLYGMVAYSAQAHPSWTLLICAANAVFHSAGVRCGAPLRKGILAVSIPTESVVRLDG